MKFYIKVCIIQTSSPAHWTLINDNNIVLEIFTEMQDSW